MTKELPVRIYNRGDQGTFVYSPDIAVYVQTDEYGVVDLSPYITSFTMQRNVNAPSTFTCMVDNKFARFDRVIRRMNSVVVFLKRVQWLQTFAGYISVAPWETVVPGDVMIMADCTLKRLQYTYWDPHSAEAMKLYPLQGGSASQTADGGAGAAMFKQLVVVANWDKAQIQIQQIPDKWLAQALKILKKSIDEDIGDPSTTAVRDALIKLLDADGWLGGPLSKLLDVEGAQNSSSTQKFLRNAAGGIQPITGVDQAWQQLVGKKDAVQYPANFGARPPRYSGFADKHLTTTEVFDTKGNLIRLRADAAAALTGMYSEVGVKQQQPFRITTSYMSYQAQKQIITSALAATHNKINVACGSVSCPAGISDHGWGTAIDFDSKFGTAPDESIMNQYGFIKLASGTSGAGDVEAASAQHWVFVGNYPDWPAYIDPKDNPANQHHVKTTPTNQFNWNDFNSQQGDGAAGASLGPSVFKTIYYNGPGIDPLGQALVEKRAWINDVPLLESISELSGAAMRDFQSAPNGDFIAFFPDRLGVYGKFPTMQVRDIEIVDFKTSISDKPLVTHLVSVGDAAKPTEMNTGIDVDMLITSGYVSVEQPEVMKMILGLDEVPVGLGDWFLSRFGMRPQRQDNYNITNYGYQWMDALHRFEEAWALQWQVMVEFTYMPEVYPGMRIELADHGISVYVESVVHQGSRTGGFTTNAMVSTPMRKDPKTGKIHLLRMEFNPQDFIGREDEIPDDLGETESLPNGRSLPP